MTRDEIIRMAEEAHQDLVTRDYPGHVGQLDPWTMRLLERFHALAVAAEREACANICLAQLWVDYNGHPLKGGAQGDCNIELLCCVDKIRARGQ